MITGMKIRFAAVLMAALLSSAAANAQTMEFACPDPGTTFTYDSRGSILGKAPDPALGLPAVTLSYLPSGRRSMMVDATGTTV